MNLLALKFLHKMLSHTFNLLLITVAWILSQNIRSYLRFHEVTLENVCSRVNRSWRLKHAKVFFEQICFQSPIQPSTRAEKTFNLKFKLKNDEKTFRIKMRNDDEEQQRPLTAMRRNVADNERVVYLVMGKTCRGSV